MGGQSRITPRLRPLAVLSVSLLLLATGCARLRSTGDPKPPDYARVTISARAQNAPPPAVAWSDALAETYAATERRPLSQGAAADQLLFLADRAEVRRAALRRLGEQILATTAQGSSQTLSQAYASHPDQLAALNDALLNGASFSFSSETSATLARAEISRDQLRSAIEQLESVSRPKFTQDESEVLHRDAFERAMEQAKAKLKEDLLTTPISGERIAAEFFADQPAAMSDLDALLFILQPDEVRYPDPASCEVTLFFDRNLVREIARRQGGLLTRLFPW